MLLYLFMTVHMIVLLCPPAFLIGLLFHYIMGNPIPYNSIYGISVILILAPVLNIFLFRDHIRAIKTLSFASIKDVYAISHSRDTVLKLPYEKVFEECLNSLSTIHDYRIPTFKVIMGAKYKVIKSSIDDGLIKVKITGSKFTSDRMLEIVLHKFSETDTEIQMTIKPCFYAGPMDYGRGLTYIEGILKYLKNQETAIPKLATQ